MAHDLYAQHIEHLDAGYQRALEATGFDAVVVHAGVPLPKSPFDDQFWPFEPVPAFAHWAPVAWPGSAVLVRRGQALSCSRIAKTASGRPRSPSICRCCKPG